MRQRSQVSPTEEAARKLRRSSRLGDWRKRAFGIPPAGERLITETDLRGQERTPEPTNFRTKAKEKPCTLTFGVSRARLWASAARQVSRLSHRAVSPKGN